MGLLILSSLLLISALVSDCQREINTRDACSSSLLRHCESPWPGLRVWDSFAPASLLTQSSKNQCECLTLQNTTQSFCIYSFHAFADGRGISILTTPDRIELIQRLPAFIEKGILSGVNRQTSPPYEERQLPSRGRGLIASKTLHRGDRIFAHTPVLMLDADAENLDENEWVELENMAVNWLPPETRKLFWNLYGQPGVDPASDRINTNAFEIEIGEFTHYAVFPEIARLNHDCRPNAAYFFDQNTLTHYVHAITTITPGTEITITYIDPHMLRRERRFELSLSWGFNCSCSLCSMHPSLTQASDTRLGQIEALTNHIEDKQTASPQIAQTLISLYEQERLYASLGDAYRLAALTFCAEGHHWNTIQHALLAIEFGMLNDGFGSEDVELMKSLAEQPEKQSCWLVKHRENTAPNLMA